MREADSIKKEKPNFAHPWNTKELSSEKLYLKLSVRPGSNWNLEVLFLRRKKTGTVSYSYSQLVFTFLGQNQGTMMLPWSNLC